ncbi:GW domain-containing glycosaminoglycan-binding protein [Sporolactobacillus sp. THM19-2]|uniref:GW domain-containing glycosaminoglycan-binding protein n=1 Tax=Sporolactobacillus sp. THM19-2 TaxID=2511171 RepID=UPI00101F1AEB|nr:GW domain-containing glycosaminoglycan-binding protein [Sporolactobacillus sp. THM19-2]RYL93949.1 GW domain-containing glycosaminoglycan-binding protein [Sporolactobacillus sp. THM19-2]
MKQIKRIVETVIVAALISIFFIVITPAPEALAKDGLTYNKEIYNTAQVAPRSWDGIWSKPYGVNGAQWLGYASKFKGKQVELIREAQTSHGVYDQFRINNQTIGWIDKAGFRSVKSGLSYNKVVSLAGTVHARSWDSIWSAPYPVPGAQWKDRASNYNGKQVNIIREARTTRGTYYQFQLNGRTIGWTDKNTIQNLGDRTYYNKEVFYSAKMSPKSWDGVWSAPYRTPGAAWRGSASKYSGRIVDITREARTNHGIYYQFRINGRVIGWVDKTAFQSVKNGQVYNKEVSLAGILKPRSWDGIWSAPYPLPGASWSGFASKYNGKQLDILREAKTYLGTYYQIGTNGEPIGWVDKSAVPEVRDRKYYDKEVYYVGQLNPENWDGVWSAPYQVPGVYWKAFASKYDGKQAEIIREAKTNHGTYYQFRIDGQTIGWADKRVFSSVKSGLEYNKSVNFVGQIHAHNWDGIWSGPYPLPKVYWINFASYYNGKQAEILREAKTARSTYYQIRVDGRILGWMDKSAIILVKEYQQTHYDYTLNEAVQKQVNSGAKTDSDYPMYIYQDALKKSGNQATVINGKWNVRGGPGTNFWMITQVNTGKKVKVIQKTGSWYQVDFQTGWINASPADVRHAMDPVSYSRETTEYFQFLKLSAVTNVYADEVNSRILSNMGILSGKAEVFLQAARNTNINEIYLISHALHETGNGRSELANGVVYNGKTVYNMFGIGANDSDPIRHGAEFAYSHKWFTPEAAILGGAQFIGQNYIHNPRYQQNTLYKMRWNPAAPASHQYATDIGWAVKQTDEIKQLYDLLSSYKLIFDVPQYQ